MTSDLSNNILSQQQNNDQNRLTLDSYWEIRFGLVLSDSQLNNSVKLLVSINMAETCEQLSSWQSAVCLLQISAATSLPLPQTYANIQMTNIFQAHLYKLCPCTCADKSFFTRFKFHFSTVYSRHLWRGILVYSPKGEIQLRNICSIYSKYQAQKNPSATDCNS